jgi:hypothetical protein
MTHSKTVRTLVCGAALLTAITGTAQTLGPGFTNRYSVRDLGVAGDVPSPYGALHFKTNDSATLLMGGHALAPEAKIYQIQVARDAQNHISGFAAASTYLADAPGIPPQLPLDVEGGIDGGLDYGPGGVLFYTSSSDGAISQIKPGSTFPSKQTRLRDLDIDDARGGLAFVPAGFPGAGRLKIVSWSSHPWCDTTVTSDGAGTFDIASPAKWVDIVSYATSLAYVKADGSAFTKDSVLVTSQLDERVVVYEVDANGDPIPVTLRELLSNFWVKAAAVDPLTGDILLATADPFSLRILLIGRLATAQTQVRITSPAEGSSFTGPATFPVNAEATQPGGAIARVDFYVGSTLVGSPTHAPFSALADNLAGGSYTLTAVAIDGSGNATTSAPVHVSVVNNGPHVTLVYPSNNMVLAACSDLKLMANVQPGNSEIATVEFFRGASSLNVSHRPWDFAPYVWTDQDLDEGTQMYSVSVTDQNGFTGVAVVTNIVVQPLPLHKLVIHHYQADQLRFCFKGVASSNYVWQTTPSLLPPQWSPWLTNTASAGRLQVTIPFNSGSPRGFYRTRRAN